MKFSESHLPILSGRNFRQTKITDSKFNIKKLIHNTFCEKKTDLELINPLNKDLRTLNGYLKKKTKRSENVEVVSIKTNSEFDSKKFSEQASHSHFVLIDKVNELSKRKNLVNEDYKKDEKEIQLRLDREINFIRDLKKFVEKNKSNEFMLKHFPENYTIDIFYSHLQKEKRRTQTYMKTFPNNKFITHQTNLRSNLNECKIYFPQLRVWSPNFLHIMQIKFYVVIVKKFWYHEKIEWTQEGALEFLMLNQYNMMTAIKLIKRNDLRFVTFIKKYSRVKKISEK